jgi:plasmid stability protein
MKHTVHLGVVLDKDTHDRVRLAAARSRKTMSRWAREALTDAVERAEQVKRPRRPQRRRDD